MRIPKYLSPSALNRFERNRDDFYLDYLCEHRPPKVPQSPAMSVGSAFDSFCKAELYWRAFGRRDEKYTFDYLFSRSVEPQNRDFAFEAGKYIFESYQRCGAFTDLDELLQASDQPPQFEVEVTGTIDGTPLLGRPDCRFFHKCGVHVVFDWKVNGYCSKHAYSPCKYYSHVYDCWGPERAPPSRNANKPHPEYRPYDHHGVTIHEGFLEGANNEWADQLSTYAWLLGEPVGGEDVVMAVHQIVAKPLEGEPPLLRAATFAARVSAQWQRTLVERYKKAWTAIQTGLIFDGLSLEECQERAELLDRQAIMLKDNSPLGQYIREITR